MLTATLALAFASASVAFAQKSYNVTVGANGNLAYDPPFIMASAGDIVMFEFYPKNHTASQSSFDTPCTRLDGGSDTDFIPVTDPASPQVRQYTVPQSNGPLWFYCRQTGHCGKGMVFAINPPSSGDHSFQAFQARAIAQNGTSTSSVAPTTTVPPPVVVTVTATVTVGTSTYLTTYASWEGSPPPTPAASPMVHQVDVGPNGALQFNPANITASIGDTITFTFHQKNHTVTQSTFGIPCQSQEKSTGKVGIDSGFMPVAANATTFPTFNITVNTTAPIWIYCRQTSHCPQGMVFSANAVESGPNNFAAFKALALASNSSANSTATATATGTGAASPTSGAISASVTGVGLTGILAVIGIVALVL